MSEKVFLSPQYLNRDTFKPPVSRPLGTALKRYVFASSLYDQITANENRKPGLNGMRILM
jgi:hypothetical protein